MRFRVLFRRINGFAAPDTSRKIGIHAFFVWLTVPVLAVLLLIYVWVWLNLSDIQKVADEVRTEHLTSILNTQRTLLNIESLRRSAEMVYITENSEQRRRSRLIAQALANESVFETNSRFSGFAGRAGMLITRLADIRTAGDAATKRYHTAHLRFVYLAGMLRSKEESSLLRAGILLPEFLPDVTIQAGKKCTEPVAEVFRPYKQLWDYCGALPPGADAESVSMCAEFQSQGNTISKNCLEREASEQEAKKTWSDFDKLLRQLSDSASNEEANITYATMEMISRETVRARTAFLISSFFMVAFFFVFFMGMRRCILAPLSWASLELDRIRNGERKISVPFTRIRELATLLSLVPRLGDYLAELDARSGDLEKEKEHYVNMSLTDALTCVANRRHFDLQLGRFSSIDSLAILMIDIDLFKLYNDSIGHQGGDECLKQVATCLRHSLQRASDAVFRYGGEEFVVLLPGADGEHALHVAQRLADNVRELRIAHPSSSVASVVTISIGVASRVADDETPVSNADLLARADYALYVAKARGRNRVHAFDAEDSDNLTCPIDQEHPGPIHER